MRGADPGAPQSWNMYSYAQNNPLRYIDPTGLDACEFSNGTLDNSPETGGPNRRRLWTCWWHMVRANF